jgi:BioD-like phosphotransacetylase family protein
MKSLYINSVEPYSGKTAVCLSLGRYFQGRNLKVGYLKPVSTQPWRSPEGTLADEDAVFVHSSLGLSGDAVDSSSIIITSSTLRRLPNALVKEKIYCSLKVGPA